MKCVNTVEKIIWKLREKSEGGGLDDFLIEVFQRELNGEIGPQWKKEYKSILSNSGYSKGFMEMFFDEINKDSKD